MWNHHYNVVMRTPIGARYGTMAVTVENSKIHGMLYILKKANPFVGTINEKGDCCFKGELTTLMRTIPYDATGHVTEESLHLNLKGARETFELSGKAVSAHGTHEKEKRA